MEGAREFSTMFKTGQYDKLFLTSSHHARGKTFHIHVLPEDVKVESREELYKIKGRVEVYGIIGGQPGWTERYGWIHQGKWCADFGKLVIAREEEIKNSKSRVKIISDKNKVLEQKLVAELLEKY